MKQTADVRRRVFGTPALSVKHPSIDPVKLRQATYEATIKQFQMAGQIELSAAQDALSDLMLMWGRG